jgi:hypothetical protein
VKVIRAQPVRARMLISNVLYNCNASLSPQEVQEKAAKVHMPLLHVDMLLCTLSWWLQNTIEQKIAHR